MGFLSPSSSFFSLRRKLASVLCIIATAYNGVDGAASFSAYQFVNAAGNVHVYWYNVPFTNTVKFMFQCHYDDYSETVGKFCGIGFRKGGETTMGPGVFYTGQTNTLNVTARHLDSGNGFPFPWYDASLESSGCEFQNSTLYCYIIRKVDGSGVSPNLDLSQDAQLMWAFADLSNNQTGLGFHMYNKGYSKTTSFTQSSPELPHLTQDGLITVSWTPTPLGNLDVYMNADFTSLGGVDLKWIGFGLGRSSDSMGPCEVYTGESGTLQITDRYLASGFGRPPARSTSNILPEGGASPGPTCSTSGNNLSCGFSRPLTTTESDSVSGADDVHILWAVGPVQGTIIEKHDFMSLSNLLAVYDISTSNIASDNAGNMLIQVHGCLMIIAWLWLLPSGIYVARFRDVVGMGKEHSSSGPPLWWRIHQANQYTGVVLIVVSLIIIFTKVNVAWSDGYLSHSHTGGAHQICGIVSFVLTLLQPLLATMRNGVAEKDEKKQEKCHHIWHIVHMVCGYLALVLAFAAVALGIEEYNWSDEWPALYAIGYAFSVVSFFAFALAGIGLLVCRERNKTKNSDSAQTGDMENRKLLRIAKAETPRQWLVWILYALLFVGAVLCIIAVAKNPYRQLLNGV